MPQGEYLQYGGQAIVEGVMMRSPRYFSVACRAPNGEIVLHTEALEKTWIGRQKWLKLPFLRGTLAILDAMALGTRAMKFASNVQIEPAYQPDASAEDKKKLEQGSRSKTIQGLAVGLAMVAGIALGFFLFNVLPQSLAQFTGLKSGDRGGTATNYVAEVFKLAFFIGYLWLISRMAAIQEVFKYHGAEHKAINTLEAGQDLTIENCKRQTRLHPRCGTSFAVIVFIVSFLLMPLVPRYPVTGAPGNPFQDVTVRLLIEICILPIIAGISYEMIRIAGKFRNQAWVNVAFQPGLLSQRVLTTIEPEEPQIEVALASLQAVVHAEKTGELLSESGLGPEAAPEPATA